MINGKIRSGCCIFCMLILFRCASGIAEGVKAGTRGCGFGELEVYESKVVVDTYAGKGVIDVGNYIFL